MQKNVPLVKQNVMKFKSFFRKTENLSEEKEGMGEREKREERGERIEKGSTEKRKETKGRWVNN